MNMKRDRARTFFIDGISMLAGAFSLNAFQTLRYMGNKGSKGKVYNPNLADVRYLNELREDPPTRQLRRQFERLASKPDFNGHPRLF